VVSGQVRRNALRTVVPLLIDPCYSPVAADGLRPNVDSNVRDYGLEQMLHEHLYSRDNYGSVAWTESLACERHGAKRLRAMLNDMFLDMKTLSRANSWQASAHP
jgi:hypothetical protein